jgi:hypothetical protein
MDKFVDHVFLNGEIENMTIQVEMEDLDQSQWEALLKTDAQRQNFVLQEGHKVRVTLESWENFHLSRLRVFGDAGALTG